MLDGMEANRLSARTGIKYIRKNKNTLVRAGTTTIN